MNYNFRYFLLFIFILSCVDKNFDKNSDLSSNVELILKLEGIIESDQKYRLLMQVAQSSHERDSLWKLQKNVDRLNTRNLLEITKELGYPNPDRLKKPLNLWVIFHHAPSEFHSELEKVLKFEVNEGRFGKLEYEMVKWTLGGRNGVPKLEGVQVIDNR